jgi:serine/threonine protein kinase
MAPERFTAENDVPTRASDMWAFGCVCLEVIYLLFRVDLTSS